MRRLDTLPNISYASFELLFSSLEVHGVHLFISTVDPYYTGFLVICGFTKTGNYFQYYIHNHWNIPVYSNKHYNSAKLFREWTNSGTS